MDASLVMELDCSVIFLPGEFSHVTRTHQLKQDVLKNIVEVAHQLGVARQFFVGLHGKAVVAR